jgi:predicted glycosyltransferase
LRFLFDVVHPAHAHFARFMVGELDRAGHETIVVARDKDVTLDLLTAFGIPFTVVGGPARPGRVALARELVARDASLVRTIRRRRVDVVVTRNPAGVQAARLAGARGVFDTDDGSAVGVHFRAARPFAHVITTPDCIGEDFGRKHVTYPSYKALAFLHPDRFTPDHSVRAELGLGPDDPYAIVRFVAFRASHDTHQAGLGERTKRTVVERLQRHGAVFVTSEARLPADLEPYALPVAPHRLHDALAFATVCVTDGQSMAGEAAALGVPSVRSSSFSGSLAVFRDLRDRYGLVSEFRPGDDDAFLRAVDEIAGGRDRGVWQERRARLLAEKCDLTTWFVDFLLSR